ncbi:alpha/beta fold hydrolase [Pseudomonas tolaasii]|uniref:alpha/beta fold hydrolase n=1 Tax=Pseudomonas tolaasii TaxID=29442 RepID=UPI00214B21C7|nr:alpha/beta hydrolase [Pseudomonas tolaasii]
MMGPHAPRRYREEACWIYSRAGFGVYAGDLGFYSEQFDGEVIGAELRDTPIPIQLLTGEYDYSASPENTQILTALISNAEFKSMPGLGHFPMIEHPLFFRPYLVEALHRIDERNARRCVEQLQA